ncbi:MAG: flippase-like domain-containing protein [Alloprevotella sp.]|nr:flippase-like domain-containing protein [Alloprevotella sp.]MBR1645109.1 flippase-like domain-containing protein [Bacteroidales bacterium]MBR1652569.1 flippase-like domain-containing protein [Alloprevotella sp.]
MRPLYRNLFLLFGILAICFMLYSFGVDFGDVREMMKSAGFYLPAIVGVWVVVYAFNAGAFQTIVNSGDHGKHLSFRHAYKLTVSGFAFSYTTPFGFGGLPYRIMELSSHVGAAGAVSATTLYSMMHILSHFCLWATALPLFLALHWELMTSWLWTLFAIFILVLAVVVYFFYYGYKNGMVVKLYRLLFHIPFVRRYAHRFYDRHIAAMEETDRNIARLHSRPRAFYSALGMEYVGRVVNSLEYFFILRALGIPVDFGDALIVLAFSSLIGNLLFFFPMQLGAREGSLAAIVRLLGFGTPTVGLFASFYTRIRELFWIFVGVGLVKVGNKSVMKTSEDKEN